MILLIDNYDSFSYNLVQLAGSISPDIGIVRNDAVSEDEIAHLNPSHIILSPGPGHPKNAGICERVVLRFGDKIPILGICLGHQAICEAYGAEICLAEKLMHGKKSQLEIDTQDPVFKGLPGQIEAARYHSLVARKSSIPACLKITAWGPFGEVMAVRHISRPTFGLQFHPESILTPHGRIIMENFLRLQ
ncbi:MAG: aminodeoxychorismate/anthranilate synthase component II [Clostridiales bacterium]|nr:aminodeoxychorismate/anthranilate synthase component II [Clostridiales bacterium]